MSVTSARIYTLWCDDTRGCDGGAEHGCRAAFSVTKAGLLKRQVLAMARTRGWVITDDYAQCPFCAQLEFSSKSSTSVTSPAQSVSGSEREECSG